MSVSEMYKFTKQGNNDFGIQGYYVPYTDNPSKPTVTSSWMFGKDKSNYNDFTVKHSKAIPASSAYELIKKNYWERAEGKFKKCKRQTYIDIIKEKAKNPGPSAYDNTL